MSKARRWVAVSDTHGDQIDRDAERQFFDFVEDYKPHIRLHMGDVFDFRAWRKGADKEEKAESMLSDVESGLDFLRRYKPRAVLWGNHDDRLFKIARDGSGPERMHARQLIGQIEDTLPKTKFIKYDVTSGICRIGDIAFLHGYQCNQDTAKNIALQYGGGEIRRVVQGHVHHFSSHTSRSLGGVKGHTIGCLARLDMEYAKARPATMSHGQGWCYGEQRGGVTTFTAYELPTKQEPVYAIT